MTDWDLVAKKLAFVESCLADLERLARPELIETDVREERFVSHTLQIAIQAALDTASHIVSNDRLGEPETNRALFEALHQAGWMSEALTATLADMVGFRNILVHGYQSVDTAVVRDVLEQHLGDLRAFVEAIRTRQQELSS